MENIYSYKVISSSGIVIKDYIAMQSDDVLVKFLYKKKLHVVSYRKENLNFLWMRVTFYELLLFFTYLDCQANCNVLIQDSLRSYKHITKSKGIKIIIADMCNLIGKGYSLYEVFEKHNRIFSREISALIMAAESSGSLKEVLPLAISHLKNRKDQRNHLLNELRYPFLVFIFSMVALFSCLYVMLPYVEKMVFDMGENVPAITALLIWFWKHLSFVAPIFLLLSLGGISIVFTKYVYKIPIIGSIISQTYIWRFSIVVCNELYAFKEGIQSFC